MDPAAPVYGFLSGVMLTMCTVFLAWWLAVVVISMARQLPLGSAFLGRIANALARQGRGVHLLFSAPSSASVSVRAGGTTRKAQRASVVAAAASVGADRSGAASRGDPSIVGSSSVFSTWAHPSDVASQVDKSVSHLVPESPQASESVPDGGTDSMRFATVNPLRNKHQPSTATVIDASEPAVSPLLIAGAASTATAAEVGVAASSERGRRVGRALLSHRA